MRGSMKAEFRKLFTVRTTYVWILFAGFLLTIAEFYVAGYRGSELPQISTIITNELPQAVAFTSLLFAVNSLLLVTNEYRYNTITYTMTAAKRRMRVYLSKALVISIYALLCSALVLVVTPLLIRLGYAAHGASMPEQTIYYQDIIWRSLFYGWGFSMMAFFIAILVRSQVGAIILLFVAPGTVEGLLGLVLKDKAEYLPFTSLSNVIQSVDMISHSRAAFIFLGNFAVLSAISIYLFLKRDAN